MIIWNLLYRFYSFFGNISRGGYHFASSLFIISAYLCYISMLPSVSNDFYDRGISGHSRQITSFIVIDSPYETIFVGDQPMQLRAFQVFADNTTLDVTELVTWESFDVPVAQVIDSPGSKGQVIALSSGAVTISATLEAQNIESTIDLKSYFPPSFLNVIGPEIAIHKIAPPLVLRANLILDDGTNLDVSERVVWTSEKTEIAVVSNQIGSRGEITTRASGVTTIRATLVNVIGEKVLKVLEPSSTLNFQIIAPREVFVSGELPSQFYTVKSLPNELFQDMTEFASWRSDNMTVMKVSDQVGSKGLTTAQSKGNTVIHAEHQGQSSYAQSIVAEFTKIDIENNQNVILVKDPSVQLNVVLTLDNSSTLNINQSAIWSSDNIEVVEISNQVGSKGRVKGKLEGQVTISTEFQGHKDSIKLWSIDSGRRDDFRIIGPEGEISIDEFPVQFNAIAYDREGTPRVVNEAADWTSSNLGVAIVNDTGQVTANTPGPVTITAFYRNQQDLINLQIIRQVSLTVDTPQDTITVGDPPLPLQAIETASDGSTRDVTEFATWTSSNLDVASVSNEAGVKGQVTARSPGMVTITAEFNGRTGQVQLTVIVPESLRVFAPQDTITVGDRLLPTSTRETRFLMAYSHPY